MTKKIYTKTLKKKRLNKFSFMIPIDLEDEMKIYSQGRFISLSEFVKQSIIFYLDYLKKIETNKNQILNQ